MKAIKRLTALVIMLCILLSVLPATASAATSGTCGTNLNWSLNGTTLTITGSGKMYDYEWGGAPWYECVESIEKVVIGSGVTYIGSAAFIECYNLTSVTIPNTVTHIGAAAFSYCLSLTAVTLPGGLEIIGGACFTYSGLTGIKIPASVYQIDDYAFAYCLSLKKIEVDANNSAYESDSSGVLFSKYKTVLIQAPAASLFGKYTVPAKTSAIAPGAFTGCIGITEAAIHSNVTAIGDLAFGYCLSLQKITVSQSNNFYLADDFGVLFNKNKTELIQAPIGLRGDYTVPMSVKKIGKQAFELTNLSSVMIPGSVEFIDNGAFQYSEKLSSVVMASGVTYIQDYAFYQCNNLKTVKLPDSVVYIGSYAFANTAITGILLPDRELHIASEAFYGCELLKTITIPESVASLGNGAFAYCTALTSATIGGFVGTIGDFAFYGCENLTTVKISEGVGEIGSFAFSGCKKLSSIAVPRSLYKVDIDAFFECDNLLTVFYKGKSTNKDGIGNYGGNDSFFYDAAWHYKSVELQGKYPAYYCGECDKCFFLDNTESHFTDVLTNNWQFSFAKYAVDNNLMAGTGTDAYGRVTFLPDKAITREEFVQVLYNAEGKPVVESEKVFPDVAEGGWYKNAVLWAFENNIASGLGDGNFGIGRKITRQDLALMLYKYASLKGYSLDATADTILQYGDGSAVSDYAKTAMDWAVTNGILSGKGTAGKPLSTFRLDPAGTATRAECAAMLRNFMTKFNP